MIRYIAADRIEMAHPYIKGTGNKSNPLAIQVYLLQKESIVGQRSKSNPVFSDNVCFINLCMMPGIKPFARVGFWNMLFQDTS